MWMEPVPEPTEETIGIMAVDLYGNNPHSFGGQRDGFKRGFKKCLELLKGK